MRMMIIMASTLYFSTSVYKTRLQRLFSIIVFVDVSMEKDVYIKLKKRFEKNRSSIKCTNTRIVVPFKTIYGFSI